MISLTFSALLLALLLPACCAVTLHPPALQKRATSKAGLAWPDGPYIDMNQYTSSGKVSWYYTWGPSPDSAATIEFVPMLWGTKQLDEWSSINQTIEENKVVNVLGFNEPENPAQSNMTAQEGADLWRQYLEPLKASHGVRLGAPAPDGDEAGKTWLQDWLTLCNGGCNPDFLALHWYGTDVGNFIAYLNDYHYTFNLSVWVTEWACQNFVDVSQQCSADDIVSFMNQTQAYMDETDWVERYSWFGAMTKMPDGVNSDDAIMSSDGKINSLGQQYIGATGTATISAASRLRVPHSVSYIYVAIGFSTLFYAML
ncbi:glycoside hydrolase family 128 protein [Peniophora sp. CONT]|nr:glycoside hydrolase family 128 protein [Peniophora sp. CONT]